MIIKIENGRVLDPATSKDGIFDILIENDKIVNVDTKINDKADVEIDATGCFVMPGFIDLHVHLRDPGLEYKEDILSGTKAAARGGFTTVLAMPNTKPTADCGEVISYVHNKAKEVGVVNVLQVGAITKGQQGIELADIEEMVQAGSPAISEDGKSVMDPIIYKEAMIQASKLNIPILAHCEDEKLVQGGVVNADENTKALGLKGITNEVEDIIVARDILLAKETNTRLHLCHCSTKDSVRLIKKAKEEGLFVSGEVCPHHFTLTTADMKTADTNFKMNPPLRQKEDVEALIAGLQDGTMEAISTDHAPHHEDEKNQPMEKAPFGIVGLETAAALTYSELVEKGYLTPMQMAEKLSYNPAKIISLDKGSLETGKIADLVIFDPTVEYAIDKNKFASKGKNTPFQGRIVKGLVKYTIVSGKIVYNQLDD